MTPTQDPADQGDSPPLLRERLPELASELEQCLNAASEHFLASSVQMLRIYSACECSDITCGSFYTGPRPDGAFGPSSKIKGSQPTANNTAAAPSQRYQ